MFCGKKQCRIDACKLFQNQEQVYKREIAELKKDLQKALIATIESKKSGDDKPCVICKDESEIQLQLCKRHV
jgi:hypothetical protein